VPTLAQHFSRIHFRKESGPAPAEMKVATAERPLRQMHDADLQSSLRAQRKGRFARDAQMFGSAGRASGTVTASLACAATVCGRCRGRTCPNASSRQRARSARGHAAGLSAADRKRRDRLGSACSQRQRRAAAAARGARGARGASALQLCRPIRRRGPGGWSGLF
jgi:hypothetical protein